YAPPQVSGAGALLAHAFANLTRRPLADILLRAALDAGAAGTDALYGRRILDNARAFQPHGTPSLSRGTTSMPLRVGTGTGSPAMGDALAGATLPAIVLDEYDRAFEADLAGTLQGAEAVLHLNRALGMEQRHVSLDSDRTSVALSIDGRGGLGQLRR